MTSRIETKKRELDEVSMKIARLTDELEEQKELLEDKRQIEEQLSNEVEEFRQQLQERNEEAATLRSSLGALQGEMDGANAMIAQLKETIAVAEEDLARNEQTIADQNAEVERLSDETKRKDEELAIKDQTIASVRTETEHRLREKTKEMARTKKWSNWLKAACVVLCASLVMSLVYAHQLPRNEMAKDTELADLVEALRVKLDLDEGASDGEILVAAVEKIESKEQQQMPTVSQAAPQKPAKVVNTGKKKEKAKKAQAAPAPRPVGRPPKKQSKPEGYKNYEIKRGDSLWSICEKELGNGAECKRIAKENGLTEKDLKRLKPGRVIRLSLK